jgi:hypothetical protein
MKGGYIVALPKRYLTGTKNLDKIFAAIQSAKAPDKVTQKWLEQLGFTSSGDRLVIGVLKDLGFTDDSGKPRERYFQFLDQTQAPRIMAEAIREAYSDLFGLFKNAQSLTRTEIINKFKTLGEGRYSDEVLDKMALTFMGLRKFADFDAPQPHLETSQEEREPLSREVTDQSETMPGKLSSLVYNIQIHLPESRDPAVYDVLFRSLREHLL